MTPKSPQISWILPSVLADFCNAVVWMVVHLSFYFQVLQSFYQFFGDFTEWTNYKWYQSLSYSIVLSDVSLGQSTYLSCHFLSVLTCGQSERQSPRFSKFSYFVDYY